jgi:hypothetical protein
MALLPMPMAYPLLLDVDVAGDAGNSSLLRASRRQASVLLALSLPRLLRQML